MNECPVCILKAENVLLRKENETLREYVTERKVNERVESLKSEVGKVNVIWCFR